jgi:hypothetical protein
VSYIGHTMGKCRVAELGEGAAVEVRAGWCNGVEAGIVTWRCAARTSWQIAVRSFRVVGARTGGKKGFNPGW